MAKRSGSAPPGAPMYVNGREVTPPPRPPTPKQLNRENRRHWRSHALRERIEATPYLTAAERALSLTHAEQTVERQLLDEDAVRDATQRREADRRLTAEADARARSFAGRVRALRDKNPRLSKTAALKKAANEASIPIRTAWAYLN